ncbi:MAG: hypothetical protein WAM53_19045 [Terrimicrobiaceae bacterium]
MPWTIPPARMLSAMFLPIRWLPELDDAAGRQLLLVDLPALHLLPIEHRHGLVRLGPGGALRILPGEDAHA